MINKIKKLKFIIPIAFGLIACSAVFAADGSGISGGAGHPKKKLKDAEGAAWFLGTAPIYYCIDRADDFPYEADALDKMIQDSMRTWRNYLSESTEKQINIHVRQIWQPKMEERYGKGELSDLKINMNLQRKSSCDASVRLTFIFGKISKRVTDAVGINGAHVGASIRESYDLNTGMGSGFVFIDKNNGVEGDFGSGELPDWRNPNALALILSHQIGHVLGNSHRTNTIMDENIAGMIFQGWKNSDKQLSALRNCIDITSQLVTDGPERYLDVGKEYALGKSIPMGILPRHFTTITGRKPKGDITMIARPWMFGYDLEIKDQSFEKHYTLNVLRGGLSGSSQGKAFYRVRKVAGIDSEVEAYLDSSSGSGVGNIEGDAGRKIPVKVSRNDSWALTLELIPDPVAYFTVQENDRVKNLINVRFLCGEI